VPLGAQALIVIDFKKIERGCQRLPKRLNEKTRTGKEDILGIMK
jgi:hypothetical protein